MCLPQRLIERRSGETKECQHRCSIWTCCLAELVGTFFSYLRQCSANNYGPISSDERIDLIAKTVPGGMLVGRDDLHRRQHIWGALIQPLPWLSRCVAPFHGVVSCPIGVLSLIASVLAAGSLLLMFGNVQHMGANVPHLGIVQSAIMEVIWTFCL